MKTSINVPDWLHQAVCDSDPEITFSEQCRDALLIAMPVWRRETERSTIERRLKAKVRMLEADAARAQVLLPERRHRRARPASREAAATPAPDSRPARRRPAGPQSQTRA